MTPPHPNNANRLALGLMAARGVNYPSAIETLESLTLSLVCDEEIRYSSALQAAFVTALNCGRRAFLGGVRVTIPADVKLLLPWPGHTSLNEVVDELGETYEEQGEEASHTVYFGFIPEDPLPYSLTASASGWRGGIEPAAERSRFENGGGCDFALGGVFAGGLAVHRGFLRATGISIFACDERAGISLWDPHASWLARSADGPALRALPRGLWLLGLGHLGQAYLWTLGLLPFADPSKCELMLQDFDFIESANVGSGLLCGNSDTGSAKTRICSGWLEARGFRTKLCERPFDEFTHCGPSEPVIALCGFDKPEPRRILENAGFVRVIECGLGGSINDFDLVHIHNFPGIRSAADIWESTSYSSAPNSKVAAALAAPGETCGALAIETAGKSVSTSFIGAMASSLVFGELLRAFHRGPRFDELFVSPRNATDSEYRQSELNYVSSDIAAAGFSDVANPRRFRIRRAA